MAALRTIGIPFFSGFLQDSCGLYATPSVAKKQEKKTRWAVQRTVLNCNGAPLSESANDLIVLASESHSGRGGVRIPPSVGL